MKLLVAALAALQTLENRFHDLVDPQGQIAKGVRDVAVATADHVKVLEARLAALELHLGIGAARESDPVAPITAAEILQEPHTIDELLAAPAVIPIPVAPELLVTDPGPG